MPALGDRVMAWWPHEQEWWYPGVICGDDGGSFRIQYDDGGQAAVPKDRVRQLTVSTGARVYCRWQGGQTYYPGRVSQVVGNALFVDYDDGDKEATSISMMRFHEREI